MLNNKKILQNYFKSISYKFFKTIYGTVDGKTSHIDDEDIILTKVKIDENKSGQQFKIKRDKSKSMNPNSNNNNKKKYNNKLTNIDQNRSINIKIQKLWKFHGSILQTNKNLMKFHN